MAGLDPAIHAPRPHKRAMLSLTPLESTISCRKSEAVLWSAIGDRQSGQKPDRHDPDGGENENFAYEST
jgi:hypothetical protein